MVCNMSNVVVWCLACRLQKHNVLVWHTELTLEKVHTLFCTDIQDDSRVKVDVLGGDSISHCEKKEVHVNMC